MSPENKKTCLGGRHSYPDDFALAVYSASSLEVLMNAVRAEERAQALKLLGWARTCVPFPSDCHAAIVAYITDSEGGA